MGLYIMAILHLCRKWWFAVIMFIVSLYCGYLFIEGIGAHQAAMAVYYSNLGM
jgi:hypothetical protein